MKNTKDVIALKAISQNLMYKSLSITGGVYGILSDIDVAEQIRKIGNDFSSDHTYQVSSLIQILEQAINNQLEEKA